MDEAFDLDVQQRLTAAQAGGAEASGIPWQPFTDVQEREAAASAAAMESVAILEMDEPSNNRALAAIAAERMQRYLNACQEANERLIDTRNAPSYDESDPLTATRLYVLTNRSEYLVALEIPYDWKTYLRLTLRAQTRCDAHVLHDCYDHQASPAARILTHKRGEILCAFKFCEECLDALTWIDFGHSRYAGPTHLWLDDGDRGDPFDF